MASRPNAKQRMEETPDPVVEAAVRDTFPASDPVAHTATQGARAVPAEELMAATPDAANDGGVTLTRRFPDMESAKLALEELVRSLPLDRNAAELREEAGGVELRLQSPPGDAARLGDMLARIASGNDG